MFAASPGARKVPLWYWHLNHWLENRRKGPRPADAPKHPGHKFWWWRLVKLRQARRRGAKAWKKHHAHISSAAANRLKVVRHAQWGAKPKVSPSIHYTEDARRDDWLLLKKPALLPQWTDCSGWDTECYFAAGLPDPNGLDYAYLGYTGTLLDTAARQGKVFTDLSQAKPGDPIVVGPGTGAHTFVVVVAGPDPLVSSHGAEGVQIIHASEDPREPKRVCQVLP
jgi:hypothetical protein